MTQHLTNQELVQFGGGKLPPQETLTVVRHLENCSACRSLAEGALDWQAAAETWSGTLHAALDDHLRENTLFDYADSTMDSDLMAEADAHLEHCSSCRDDVADLRRLRENRPRWRRTALRVAAVLILAAGLGVLVVRRTPPGPPPDVVVRRSSVAAGPETKLPASWSALVGAAVAARHIDPPAILATLRMPGDNALRGEDGGTTSDVTPDGVVVEDPSPTFRWSNSPGAVYSVSLFAGDREVARSAPLHRNIWTPDRDLERGLTYRWQVEAHRGNKMWILPRTPQPAPTFRLLDETAQRDLDAARHRDPGNHLLLGVLAAHYGLRDEAIAQLTFHHSSHPDPSTSELLASVRAWPHRERR
jgi:anti-sigma factor RsiW